ncbi:hypothetical protein NQ314_014182 [Rhamnusium bicolor]|uniref:Uncharacterized protein n=1 Tax=Rhamnusium bicolor TaxID=1586634 RepID=A0AAV8X459_9CUCU|nr:hypothetical protein NQ314_014182 [Rhamnusium bicolor]
MRQEPIMDQDNEEPDDATELKAERGGPVVRNVSGTYFLICRYGVGTVKENSLKKLRTKILQ